MEILLSPELRLTYALLLQAAALTGAWYFVSRRLTTDWADRTADTLLLALLVQYAAVALPGLFGFLSPLTIAATTLLLSAALFLAPPSGVAWASVLACPWPSSQNKHGQSSLPTPPKTDRYTLLAATLFALGYIAIVDSNQSGWPVTANDALTYHFPAAAQWLRTGHISLFETWFFNPANTYSPLAGSAFIAWWMAPIGNDVLARNVQSPALLLIFFASLRLIRAIGVRTSISALIALAILLSRPFLRQSIIEKDDLYLTAFFICAAAGCALPRLADSLAPWRIGVALGLMLGTKYTALLALPALLLLIDAPLRARWCPRRYLIVLALVLLIAGPWYLRNALLTGNPLYPIRTLGLPGLFASARSTQLSTVKDVWSLLTTRDQSLPLAPMCVVLAATVTTLVTRRSAIASNPLIRLCLLGPLISFLLFIFSSPYAEVRFLYPAFILLFAAGGLAFSKPWLQLVTALVLLFLSWMTAFKLEGDRIPVVMEMVAFATTVTIVGLTLAWAVRRFPSILPWSLGLVVIVFAAAVFVSWKAHVKACREVAIEAYLTQYDATAEAWRFVRDQLPPTETLAYTNTFLIHPMEGFDNLRPLLYIPTRQGITHLHDLPPFPGKLSGEQIVPAMATAITTDTDEAAWLQRLFASPATHLIVFDHDVAPNPPELAIIQKHPDRFERIFQNPAASVFRLKR